MERLIKSKIAFVLGIALLVFVAGISVGTALGILDFDDKENRDLLLNEFGIIEAPLPPQNASRIVEATEVIDSLYLDEELNVSLLRHKAYAKVGLALTKKNGEFVAWIPHAEMLPIYKKAGYYDIDAPGEVLSWWLFCDLNSDGIKELVVEFAIAGSSATHPFYLYSYDENSFKLLWSATDSSSATEVIDLDSDGISEIVHEYSIYGLGAFERASLRWIDIMQVGETSVISVNHEYPKIYMELIKIYDEALLSRDSSRYTKLLLCLKERASLVIRGIESNATECELLYL